MTTPTLTERYIAAVVRRIPEAKRDDVASELRASLADDIDARVESGELQASAERMAIASLGDPDRFAASLTGSSLHLIGPALYLDWRRLIVLLLGIVLPIVAGAVVLAETLTGSTPVDTVLAVGGVVANTAIGIAFWVTVVFAVIERTGAGSRPLVAWSPDDLPATDARPQVGVSVLVGGVLGLVIASGLLVAQLVFPLLRDGSGDPIPVLSPELWSWWIPYLLLVLVAELIFAIVLYRRRVWSVGLAIGNIVLSMAFAVPVIALILTDAVINPAFSAELLARPELAGIDLDAARTAFAVSVAVVVGLVAMAESADGVLKAARAARGWQAR